MTSTPTVMATVLMDSEPENDRDSVVMTVMGVSLLGLVVVVIFGFVKTRKTKNVVE